MRTAFHDTFLEELVRLDAYLSEIRGLGEEGPSAADPEVRRLLEAVAFFSARTEALAHRGMFDAVSWLAAEHCDFLRRPLAAAGLVRATDAGGWSSAVHLPQGTPLLASSADDAAAQFSTAVSAVIAPVRIVDAKLVNLSDAKWLALCVAAPVGLSSLRWLSLYVDVLGDLGRSVALHRSLSRACRSARYLEGGLASSEAPSALPASKAYRDAIRLDVRFGARVGALDDRSLPPLEQVRAHLQLPQRDLFINIELPKERRDTKAWIALELDPTLADVPLAAHTFQPNVIPVENSVRAPADPIVDDGSVERHTLRPPPELANPRYRHVAGPFELCQIERVCELNGDQETTLFPTALGEPERSYRSGFKMVDGRERPQIELGVPGSLKKPRRVRVDALWTQPGLDPNSLGRVRVRPWRLALPDVSWKLLEGAAPFAPSPLEGDPEKLLELLAWTRRQNPERDELVRLMKLLASGGAAPWRRLIDNIKSVGWRERPREEAADGTRLEVALVCRDPGEEQEAILGDLVDQVEVVLNAWCSDPVRVKAQTAPERPPLRLVGVGA